MDKGRVTQPNAKPKSLQAPMVKSTALELLASQSGSSSWNVVLKLLSITLVSLFAFSSGVWFGKKLSDSDYQRQALEGEFEKGDRSTASAADGEHGDGHQESLDDHEALTDEDVAAASAKALEKPKSVAHEEAPQGHGDGHANTHSQPHAASAQNDSHHETHDKTHGDAHGNSHGSTAKAPSAPVAATAATAKPDLTAAHQAAQRVAQNAAPVDKEKPPVESRVPAALPTTVGSQADVDFTVQVASYPTTEAAKEHVDKLVTKGFPAFPIEAKINGKVWYRVSVGSFKTYNDASKFRGQLMKQAELPSAIVQKLQR